MKRSPTRQELERGTADDAGFCGLDISRMSSVLLVQLQWLRAETAAANTAISQARTAEEQEGIAKDIEGERDREARLQLTT